MGDNSPHKFAQMCEISDSTLRRYLSGSMPSLDKSFTIAQIGCVSLEWLASGQGPMKQGEPGSATYAPEAPPEPQSPQGAPAPQPVSEPPQAPKHGHLSVVPPYADSAGLVAQGKAWLDAVMELSEAESSAILTLAMGEDVAFTIEGRKLGSVEDHRYKFKRERDREAQAQQQPGRDKHKR